jgi:hypothetical protein
MVLSMCIWFLENFHIILATPFLGVEYVHLGWKILYNSCTPFLGGNAHLAWKIFYNSFTLFLDIEHVHLVWKML